MTEPLLAAARLRVDEGGVPQVDGLSFETAGDRVLVLAGPRALFRAAAGALEPRHGELRSRGLPVGVALRHGRVASVALDPPLPTSWRAVEYVTWSARLSGRDAKDARSRADEALVRLKLEATGKTRLALVPAAARRAVVLAAALATGAETLFLEDPLSGLPEDAARTYARTILRATAGLQIVTFAPRASLASPLAIDADEALVLGGSQVLAQGAPAEIAARDRTYRLRLSGSGADFARVAEHRGARVSGQGSAWTVDLGADLRVTDLLDVAGASGTVILELFPLAEAFT